MNKQREAVYGTRKQLLEGVEQKELILEDYVAGLISNILNEFAPESQHPDQWDVAGIKQKLMEHFGFNAETEHIAFDTLNRHELGDTLFDKLKEKYELKEQIIGAQGMRYHERMIMLSVLDGLWKDHLLNMDHLKEGIGLRGYGQQDPLVAYKKESFDMFEGMMGRFQEDTVRYLFLMQIVGPDGQPITRPVAATAPAASCAAGAATHAASRGAAVGRREWPRRSATAAAACAEPRAETDVAPYAGGRGANRHTHS